MVIDITISMQQLATQAVDPKGLSFVLGTVALYKI